MYKLIKELPDKSIGSIAVFYNGVYNEPKNDIKPGQTLPEVGFYWDGIFMKEHKVPFQCDLYPDWFELCDNVTAEITKEYKPRDWQPKSGEKVWNAVIKQINVIFEFEGEWYLHGKRPNSSEQMTQKIEEHHWKSLEPYTGQDKPQIDFGKSGLILTDGELIVVTTGDEEKKCFKAKVLGGYEDTFIGLDNWRDITAEAEPILQQLKSLMNGK